MNPRGDRIAEVLPGDQGTAGAEAEIRRMVSEINLLKARLNLRRAMTDLNRTVDRILAQSIPAHSDLTDGKGDRG